MRDILIEFMDELREYVAESGTNIAHDERDSSEFVDIYLKEKQSEGVVLDVVSVSDSETKVTENSSNTRLDNAC